jgi:MYXO-CTERM domain-containing protein
VQVEVGGSHLTPGASFDQIFLTGSGKAFTVAGATLKVIPLSGVELNTPYRIVDATGNSVNSAAKFANLLNGLTYDDGGTSYTVSYNASSIDVSFSAVPEPVALPLVGLGVLLAGRRRAKTAVQVLT